MSARRVSAVLAAVCALLLLVPMSALASAQRTSARARSATPVKSLVNIPVTGQTTSGKKFKGTYTVDRFITRNGKTYAVGTLIGKLGSKSVRRSNLVIPAHLNRSLGGAHDAAVCPILHLVLGPLNLNLLGLHVHLNKVVLDITAVSGPGNLLGNLLCDVANLLNGPLPPLPLQQLTGLLNILNQLLSNPALLNL